jgi:hypothetical protein
MLHHTPAGRLDSELQGASGLQTSIISGHFAIVSVEAQETDQMTRLVRRLAYVEFLAKQVSWEEDVGKLLPEPSLVLFCVCTDE